MGKKHHKKKDRILRARLQDLIDRDADKASDYRLEHDRVPDLPADQLYRVDPKYSRRPVAICGNTLMGLPCCKNGKGKHCYCKVPCGNQYSLTTRDFKNRTFATPEAEAISEMEVKEALRHAHEVMATQRPEMETDIDQIVEYLMQSLQDEEAYQNGKR